MLRGNHGNPTRSVHGITHRAAHGVSHALYIHHCFSNAPWPGLFGVWDCARHGTCTMDGVNGGKCHDIFRGTCHGFLHAISLVKSCFVGGPVNEMCMPVSSGTMGERTAGFAVPGGPDIGSRKCHCRHHRLMHCTVVYPIGPVVFNGCTPWDIPEG